MLGLASVLIGVAAGRWTRWHPLVPGATVWLFGGLATAFVLAGFASPTALAAGMMVGLTFGAAGAFGAFLGLLRRQHIERIK